jgi:hypothetical protein
MCWQELVQQVRQQLWQLVVVVLAEQRMQILFVGQTGRFI